MSERSLLCASLQIGCAGFEAIPSSSAQTWRFEDRSEVGSQAVVVQEEPASREAEAVRMMGGEVEERPSRAAGEVVVAPFWLHGALRFDVVKMLMAGSTPSRASSDALSAQNPVLRCRIASARSVAISQRWVNVLASQTRAATTRGDGGSAEILVAVARHLLPRHDNFLVDDAGRANQKGD